VSFVRRAVKFSVWFELTWICLLLPSGALGARLGHDFFSLGSTGLDRDLGLESLVVPVRLYRGDQKLDSLAE